MSNNENPPSNTSNGANANPDPSNPSNPSNSNTSRPSNTSNTNSNTNPNINSNNNNSITSRIQSSASNLARSALSSTPADVTSSLPGASKAGSSRPGAGQAYYTETAPGSGSAPGSSLGSGGASGSRTGTGVESFRSTGSTGQEGDFEDVYSYGFPGAESAPSTETGAGAGAGAGTWIEEQRSGIETGNGKGKERETFEQVWTSTQRQYAQHGRSQSRAHYQAQEDDGADVLTLLSSPSFNPDFPDDGQEQIPNDLSDYQAQDTGLSPEEIQMLDSFRRSPQNQGQGQGQGQGKITQNSLIPDIDTFLSSLPAQTPTSETELRDAVLTGLSGAEDWVSVEERYQDEVWGFLKPVLQAAAKEMEESRQDGQTGDGQTGQDGPAVARLKMILMHMRA